MRGLQGARSACATRSSSSSPGSLSAFLAWRFGWGPALAAGLVFAWALIAASAIDLDTQLLPDHITLPLLWLGLLVNIGGVFVDLRSAVLGAAGGYLLLWFVYWGFKLLAGKEGMGFGDFKLLAALGAWTGWQTPAAHPPGVGRRRARWRDSRSSGSPAAGATRASRSARTSPRAGLVALLWGREAVVAYLGRFPA